MKQKLLFIAIALLSFAFNVKAQTQSKVTGTVHDNTGKGIAAVTIMLQKAQDSSLVKTAVSNTAGNYEFPLVKAGKYFVTTSATGMKKASSTAFEVKDGETFNAPAITIMAANKNLDAVTVTAKKPIVEVRADKTILNVEGTINALGNDALELLRKSPGVMVDKDDNISLAGKNGVQVYIDGKPSPLSGSDLANYLKSMQSAQIESIELITNPSAKYEAAGNAGIINIKLKKNKSFGTNGSVNAGYAIGTYAKYNGGLSLNNRNKKTNIFGTYNYNQGLNESNFIANRTQGDSSFNQTNRILGKNIYSHNFKVGADYYIDAFNTIGVVINGNIAKNDVGTAGPMNIYYNPTNTLAKVLYATGDSKIKRNNVNSNINYRYAKKGKELNIDLDYGYFDLGNDQFQGNTYYSPGGSITNSNNYHMLSPTTIDIYSAKADYEQDYKKGRLGFGAKIGYVNTDNNFSRNNVFGGGEVRDNRNRFKYKENINAIYGNYNKQYKGFTAQFGLRIENTVSDGQSVGSQNTGLPTAPVYTPFDSTLHRSYIDFFPSAAITFNKNPMKQFGLTYSRRIDRPAYQDLNPFEFRINDYTFQRGNINLRPQYTNSFGVVYTYHYKLNMQLNYSHVKDIFTQLADTINKSQAFLSKRNLANQDIVSFNISYPFQYKWYSFFTNVNSYYSNYQADLGGGNRKISLNVFAVSFYMQNSFTLSKTVKAELSGFFNSPTVYQGTFKAKAMYSVDGGLSKTILKGQGMIKASVSDIFNTMRFKGSQDFTGQHSDVIARWESRQFKLNFNYRFGNSQVKAARQRKAAIEEENKRTQSSGGIGGQ